MYKRDFFTINIINTLILSLFLMLFSRFDILIENELFDKISPFLLVFYGWYNIFVSFKSLFPNFDSTENKVLTLIKKGEINYFCTIDLLFLLLIFIFENLLSTVIFFSQFSNALVFVFSNFIFHYLFFIIGFDLGSKIIKKINFDTSIISGVIFVLLGIFNS